MGRTRRFFVLAGVLAGALLLGACGGDDTGDGAAATATGRGEVVVGGATFTEMQITQAMYAQLLEDAGYSVRTLSADNRELYAPELERGNIDVVPDYAATMTEFLNKRKNGPAAPQVASSDIDATVAALEPLAREAGLAIGKPSRAQVQNAFVVTKEFAEQNNVSTLSELAALNLDLVLAAGEECGDPSRLFCKPGLENVYGLRITRIEPLGYGTTQTKQAVKDGTAQLGLTGTIDGTLDSFGLVVLEDDKGLQLADNLIPILNADTAQDATVLETVNKVSDVLTTEDMAKLTVRVDQDREKPEDVAQEYLQEKGLL